MKFHQVRIGVESNNFPVTRSEITACPTSVVPKTPLTKLIIIYMQLEKKMQDVNWQHVQEPRILVIMIMNIRQDVIITGHHQSACHEHRSPIRPLIMGVSRGGKTPLQT